MLQAGLRARRRRCRDRCGCPAGSVRVPQPKTRASPCPSHVPSGRAAKEYSNMPHSPGRSDMGGADKPSRYRKSGVVQIRVTLETRNPLASAALAIFGVTWKQHFLNRAVRSELLARLGVAAGRHPNSVHGAQIGLVAESFANRTLFTPWHPIRVKEDRTLPTAIRTFRTGKIHGFPRF